MAVMVGLVEFGGDGPGFLLPTFRRRRFSNQQLIQCIDEHDRVIRFDEIEIDGSAREISWQSVDIEVGDPAIWAFRDHLGRFHVGTAGELKSFGKKLLSTDGLKNFPMAAIELAAFCDMEFEVVQAAYSHLSELSLRGAGVWRDSVMLLPRIKEDVMRQVRQTKEVKKHIDEMRVVTRDGVSHVYVSSALASQIKELPRWDKLAKPLNIKTFHVHPIRLEEERPLSLSKAKWVLLGVGGVAQWLTKRSSFSKYVHTQRKLGRMSKAFSIGEWMRFSKYAGGITPELVMGVFPSDLIETKFIRDSVSAIAKAESFRHVINVRPVGFGTPRKNKLPVSKLKGEFERFDIIWIVANHRQRRSDGVAHSLSASTSASRHVGAIGRSLIMCLDSIWGWETLSKWQRSNEFGLVGLVKYQSKLNTEEHVRRIIYSMLCEDADVHSAEYIVAFCPSQIGSERGEIRTSVGGRDYTVELLPVGKLSPSRDVVGLAFGVKLSKGTKSEFRDFCSSLIAGYGWTVRSESEEYLLFENEGDALRVWPVRSLQEIFRLLGRDAVFNLSSDLIVTNQTITAVMLEQAERSGWSIIHYADLGKFMRHEFENQLFDANW